MQLRRDAYIETAFARFKNRFSLKKFLPGEGKCEILSDKFLVKGRFGYFKNIKNIGKKYESGSVYKSI